MTAPHQSFGGPRTAAAASLLQKMGSEHWCSNIASAMSVTNNATQHVTVITP